MVLVLSMTSASTHSSLGSSSETALLSVGMNVRCIKSSWLHTGVKGKEKGLQPKVNW